MRVMKKSLFYPLVLFLLLLFPCYGSLDQSILSLSELLPNKETNPNILKSTSDATPITEPKQIKVIPHFDDPLWPKQWNLYNKETPTHDINVLPAWRAGLTGEGIRIALLDDGNSYFILNLYPICRSME